MKLGFDWQSDIWISRCFENGRCRGGQKPDDRWMEPILKSTHNMGFYEWQKLFFNNHQIRTLSLLLIMPLLYADLVIA